jgi:moderate conductance mechanosensitive channel
MKEFLNEWTESLLPWFMTHGLKIIFIAIGAFIIEKVVHKFIERAVRIAVTPNGFASKEAEEKRENTLIRIFSATVRIALITVTGLMILQELGVMIGPILAGAGIVGLAFGFGGQYLIRDIISGLFIILENQYRIGDSVCFDTICGTVEDISLRMTTLRDLDGTIHHVPHGTITNVSNRSKMFSRVNINIGVSYNSNIQHVIDVINLTGKALSEDPNWKEYIISPPQFLRIDDFGDSSVNVKILGDTKPSRQWEVAGEFRKRIFIAFNEAGIEIPFPQMVLHQSKG